MKHKKFNLALAAIATAMLSAGCATPVAQSTATMTTYDKDTEYAVTPRDDGYTVAVNYSRYQFIPESVAVADACKSVTLVIAHEQAEKAKRKIQPINEQRLMISMGRNGLSGITSCSASVPVQWQ